MCPHSAGSVPSIPPLIDHLTYLCLRTPRASKDADASKVLWPMTRSSSAATIGYYAAAITLGLGTAVVGPSLDGLARRSGVTIGAIGIVFTTASMGYLFGALSSGRWFDRLPGHRV